MSLSTDDRARARRVHDMAEVRQGVDALDRLLVALLAERQGYMDAAARIKPTATPSATAPASRTWSPR